MSAGAIADAGILRHAAAVLVAQAAGVRHKGSRRQRGHYPRQHRQQHALCNQPLDHRPWAPPHR
ncbi:MAG TPA: hypothetical protein VJN48_02535 [Terriglobales bacterium]|nr:hypothetical protein [Terriglobales bacterium]